MNGEFEEIIDDEGEYQIDAELYELRRKFMELKEERKKAALEANNLENKLKLLTINDEKQYKKEGKQKQIQEERELIQSKIQQEKERIQRMKDIADNELKLKKDQISVMRDNIKNVVSNWKNNLAEKNKSESQKFKMIREENEKFINSLKQEEEERNKQQCIIIKSNIINGVEKRKKLEADRKLKMKQMLENKIAEEMNIKNNIEEKISNLEEQEVEMLEKRKTTYKTNVTNKTSKSAKSTNSNKLIKSGKK